MATFYRIVRLEGIFVGSVSMPEYASAGKNNSSRPYTGVLGRTCIVRPRFQQLKRSHRPLFFGSLLCRTFEIHSFPQLDTMIN